MIDNVDDLLLERFNDFFLEHAGSIEFLFLFDLFKQTNFSWSSIILNFESLEWFSWKSPYKTTKIDLIVNIQNQFSLSVWFFSTSFGRNCCKLFFPLNVIFHQRRKKSEMNSLLSIKKLKSVRNNYVAFYLCVGGTTSIFF